MAVFCPECGKDNVQGSKFCQSCGAAVPESPAAAPVAPPAATAATAPMPAYTPPAQPYAQTPYQQPAYTPPAQPYAQTPYQQPAYQQPAYQQPAYAPAAYAPAAAAGSRRGGAFYVGAAIILLCGILILVSSFMGWFGAFGFTESGWDLMKDMQDGNQNPFANTSDMGPEGTKLMFSGLCSIIAGGAIMLFGLLLLLTKAKGLAALTLILAIAALIMAGINTYSFLSIEGIGLGAGMILFLAGSTGGAIGSIVSLAG